MEIGVVMTKDSLSGISGGNWSDISSKNFEVARCMFALV